MLLSLGVLSEDSLKLFTFFIPSDGCIIQLCQSTKIDNFSSLKYNSFSWVLILLFLQSYWGLPVSYHVFTILQKEWLFICGYLFRIMVSSGICSNCLVKLFVVVRFLVDSINKSFCFSNKLLFMLYIFSISIHPLFAFICIAKHMVHNVNLSHYIEILEGPKNWV